ncbi:hypothetical protein [Jiella mangrovi]|uniref:Sulfotransferase family protein n=1 Tax=Jiella mangrovi TaxID=2821407 RepID=A0ABS4BJX1_9HYPH|nr:hypothetical protein [Jiella mangrovi]MBP0617054.1 hypothetical protein [Jiella mangrovi]
MSVQIWNYFGMIASFSNNFIFLKTRKTGGTSVEIVLSSWCDAGDVCTVVSPVDEVTRASFGGILPVEEYKGAKVFNHMNAAHVRKIFPTLWRDAFEFTIERHPYEKVISRVYWRIGRRGGNVDQEYEAELERTLQMGDFVDRDLYSIGGKIVVDEVIDYPDMWPRLSELGRAWGHTVPDEKPNAKGQHRKDRRAAADILSERQKSRIREIAAFEFETFGYAA